jgi:protease PrsW
VFHLRVENGCRAGETITLPRVTDEPQILGRGKEAGIRFAADGTMSREHAWLVQEGGRWVLHNKSQHGCRVGRKRVLDKRHLLPGDTVVLGDTKVVFEPVDPSTPLPGHDPLTPVTPSIAAPPSAAGYDTQGVFHMGQTLLTPADTEHSFITLSNRGSGRIRIKRRRLYFLLVLAILGLAGTLSTGLLIFLPAFRERPGALLLAAAFAALPTIPYLFLIKLLDRNGQIPWKNLLACLVWGGTVGCGFSLVLNTLGMSTLAAFASGGGTSVGHLTAILVAPPVEEFIKGLGILVVFWILHDEFDNILEGMVLGAACGLGFAVVENVVYNVRFLSEGDGGTTLLLMGTYRSVVNALIGHPVYTAMTGAGLGLMRETSRKRKVRYLFPLLGLAVAAAMHMVWNWAAVVLPEALSKSGELTALVVLTLVFGGAGILFFLSAYLFAANRERTVLLAYLGEEVDKGFVTASELMSFRALFGRQSYELRGLLEGGWPVYSLRSALRGAQVELAFRKWHLAIGDDVRGSLVDNYIHAARTQIRDARNALNRLELQPRQSDSSDGTTLGSP